jgi:hypothetical protein
LGLLARCAWAPALARLPIGHPGCCFDRRRERARVLLCPCQRANKGPAPPGGGEVPQAATGRSPG